MRRIQVYASIDRHNDQQLGTDEDLTRPLDYSFDYTNALREAEAKEGAGQTTNPTSCVIPFVPDHGVNSCPAAWQHAGNKLRKFGEHLALPFAYTGKISVGCTALFRGIGTR